MEILEIINQDLGFYDIETSNKQVNAYELLTFRAPEYASRRKASDSQTSYLVWP